MFEPSMSEPFRIGVDPGWADSFETLLGGAVREHFDGRGRFTCEMMEDPVNGIVRAAVADRYDGVIVLGAGFDASTFAGVSRLTCIARWGVGFDAIDTDSATHADVLVALTPNAITRSVAEAQIALILALAKRLPDLDRRTRSGSWRTDLPIQATDVAGKTLASIGCGRIGTEMFRIARGIGFGRLLAYDPFCPPGRATSVGVELVSLDTVMASGDFVTVNAFLNSSTRGMVGPEQFALMKPTAYFVNTARGPIVQEGALIDALRRRRIAGAGIDVFEEEPPARDNPLLAMENVIVSPHSMAWTREGLAGNSMEACQNLLLVASGRVPPCLANPEVASRDGMRTKLARWSAP